MIKVKIKRKSLREDLLDEAKEDDYWESYWNKHERDFRPILRWIYGRHLGPGMSNDLVPAMLKQFKDRGKQFAPERQSRIKYLKWATNMHQIGYAYGEILNSLKLFHKYSGQMKEKSIDKYTSPNHVIGAYKEDVIGRRTGKAEKERAKSEKRATEDDRTVIYEKDNLFVIRPHTVEASCHYGRKTKWCIAQPGNEYFDDYTGKEGKVFYFIKDDRRKSDDQYAKVAIQVGLTDEENAVIDGYWDRYDNEDLPIERRVPKPISELDKFFGDEIDGALQAIKNHAMDNPPTFGEVAKLEKIDEEIYAKKYDRNNINFTSDMDDGYYDETGSLRIDINFDGSMRLEELFDGEKEINDIRGAIEDYENEVGDLEEYIAEIVEEMSWPLEFDNWYGQFEEGRVVSINDDRIRIDIHYNSEYAETERQAMNIINNAVNEHEDISEIWDAIKKVMERQLQEYISQETLQAIRGMASGINALDSKLKNLNVTYDEDATQIMVFMRKGHEIPMQFKSFNMPAQGTYDNAVVTRQVGLYATAIRRALHPLKNKIALAVDMAFNKLEDDFNKQTQLKFKGFEKQEPIKFRATNLSIAMRTPDSKAIMGKSPGFNKAVEPMKTSASFSFIIDRDYSLEELNQTFRYIMKLDTMIEDIFETALSNFDVDAAYEQINDAYNDFLVRDSGIVRIKDEDDIDPQAYSESKKRKFKVRILR